MVWASSSSASDAGTSLEAPDSRATAELSARRPSGKRFHKPEEAAAAAAAARAVQSDGGGVPGGGLAPRKRERLDATRARIAARGDSSGGGGSQSGGQGGKGG